jgi:hypothetical protein
MPFASRRQARAMFGGHIKGLTKDDAHEWAKDTNFSKLPDRAPAEKGKPTLRSKKASAAFDFEALVELFKTAALGTAVVSSNNVGKLRGMMTTNAMKAPGLGPAAQTVQPGKRVLSAINANKPH